MTTYATLCYIIEDDRVLLLKKAKGLWGEEKMWEDDRYWVPLLLAGKHFKGEFHFDEKAERLISHRSEVIER